MHVLDIILSTEVIAGIIIVASVAMTVRSVLMFTHEASGMSLKLLKLDSELEKHKEGMDGKKTAVKELTVVVDPLKDREGKLRGYYDALKNMELAHDKANAAAEEHKQEERRKRVQRKKLGFD